MLYLKNTSEYNLLNPDIEFNLNDVQTSRYYDIKDQFEFDMIINDEFKKRYYQRANTLIVGNGLITTQYSYYGRSNIKVAFCTKGERLASNSGFKDMIVLVEDNFTVNYAQEFKRLKTMMNKNGMSSRKQIKIVTRDVMSSFIFDPLAPTLEQMSGEYKAGMISEFIANNRTDGK